MNKSTRSHGKNDTKKKLKRTRLLGQLLEKRLMLAADLEVTSLTAPATAISQSNVPIDWTVKNSGDQTAPTDWFDHIYLSTDATLDFNDLDAGFSLGEI